MEKIRVMIAEDHSMIRQGLKQLIELENDMKVVVEAADGMQAIRNYGAQKPDIVLMDINMPGKGGLQALEEIKTEYPDAKIIMLQEREYLIQSLTLGAAGYILKDADSSVLIEAIRTVNEGESYIQPTMAKELVFEFKRFTAKEASVNTKSSFLSDRELEVLKLIAKGKVNKDIAKVLYISEKTVKNHISNIFKKLNVKDRTQAAVYAIKNKLVE